MILRRVLLFVACVIAVVYVLWQQTQTQSIQRSRVIMGTLVEIHASGEDALALNQLLDKAFEEMQRIEGLMSSYSPQSEISVLSRSPGLQVSPETLEVIQVGLQVAERSRGAFDLTLGQLVRLWDVGGSSPRVPDKHKIVEAIHGVGPGALKIEGNKILKRDKSLQVELGGIAKGYAVDVAAKVLREGKVSSASVNAGGDMMLVGHPQGRDWRIGIQHPRKPDELLATINVNGGAVVTSGDYQRYFEKDGIRYHHLFDPRTGYPARLCQSVTVTADNATVADALATAAFVLGPEQGRNLVEAWSGAEALLVSADGQVYLTPGMQGRVVWPQ